MKDRKKDIIFLFIATTPVSAWMIYWFIWEEDYNLLPWALLPQGVMALCIGIMILQEKHVLKRESKLLHSDFPKQWDYALEKYESSPHGNVRSESMTRHLKKYTAQNCSHYASSSDCCVSHLSLLFILHTKVTRIINISLFLP